MPYRAIFSLATLVALAYGEMFTMDWGPNVDGKYPFAEIESSSTPGMRRLAGETTCNPIGPNFQCATNTTIRADDGAVTLMYIMTECKLDSQIKFDFRRAEECRCKTTVTRYKKNGEPTYSKMCPCVVCAAGFGDNPVSIDCGAWENVTLEELKKANPKDAVVQNMTEVPDPFIMQGCTSLDCGLNCNGTCRLDCIESGEQCEYCTEDWTQPPNASGYYLDENGQPVSGNAIGNFDGTPTDGSGAIMTNSIVAAALAGMTAMMLSWI